MKEGEREGERERRERREREGGERERRERGRGEREREREREERERRERERERGCLSVGCFTSQQHVSATQIRSSQAIVRAATLPQKLQIKLSISPTCSILTPGQPAPALTL